MLCGLYRFGYVGVRAPGPVPGAQQLVFLQGAGTCMDPVIQTLSIYTISSAALKAAIWEYRLEKSARTIYLATLLT